MTLYTSSSDAMVKRKSRWKTIRRLGWGLLIAFILLGAADYTVFRNAYTYDLGRAAQGGVIGQWAHIDRAFKEVADPARIEYAIFGDSQSIDALRPDIIADELGVEADRIFNFSIVGGKPSDNAYTYRTYMDQMPNLRKVIYVVNEHQFNNSDILTDIKFKFHATLRDRLRAIDQNNYGELLTGWVFRSFGLRTEWSSLLTRYQNDTWPAESFSYPGGIRPQVWADPKTKSAEYAKEVADRWFKNWQADGVYTEVFSNLIGDFHASGLAITILQIPRTDWYEDIVASDYAAEQEQYLTRVRNAATTSGATFAIISGSETEFTLDDFRDANHVSAAGADKLSRYVARNWWK